MNVQEYIQSGIIETYVLNLATQEEVAEVEQYIITYPEVAIAVKDFSYALEKQLIETATLPPASIKEKLFSSLELNTSGTHTPVIQLNSGKKFQLWKYVAAASIVLLIGSMTLNLYYYNSYTNAKSSYQNLLAEQATMQANLNTIEAKMKMLDTSLHLMTDPAMAVVKMQGVEGKENNAATVYWDTRTKDVYILQNKLPQAPVNKQYQLWAIVNGKPVDAGVIDNCKEALCKMKTITIAQAFAITLENAGGSPTPTLSQLYVMGKV